MRLWHKDLIPVLPRLLLIGQWRECCLIARNIKQKGKPGNLLVDPVMDYPIEHFISYTYLVFEEMVKRDYSVHSSSFAKYFNIPFCQTVKTDRIFRGWHSDRYFNQCIMNLQEKQDRGGIDGREWFNLAMYVKEKYNFIGMKRIEYPFSK